MVADEVRKLAERTQKSLSETTATIAAIVQSIIDVSSEMQNSAEKFTTLLDETKKAEESIASSVEMMDDTQRVVRAVSGSSKQVLDKTREVLDGLNSVNEHSSQNVRSVEEIAKAASHLNSLSAELKKELSIFRT